MGALTAPKILSLRNAAKPLQLVMWLLVTAYRNSPTPYPLVSSLTPYGHVFPK